LRILAEVEQCQRSEVGALLRREGLYSSMLSKWRQQKAAGKLYLPCTTYYEDLALLFYGKVKYNDVLAVCITLNLQTDFSNQKAVT
jgi:hypothetical protein